MEEYSFKIEPFDEHDFEAATQEVDANEISLTSIPKLTYEDDAILILKREQSIEVPGKIKKSNEMQTSMIKLDVNQENDNFVKVETRTKVIKPI